MRRSKALNKSWTLFTVAKEASKHVMFCGTRGNLIICAEEYLIILHKRKGSCGSTARMSKNKTRDNGKNGKVVLDSGVKNHLSVHISSTLCHGIC